MRFVKMHGIGNDYVYVDGHREDLEPFDLAKLAQAASDRHFGLGSDGLVLILPSDQADFRMRMFNADGSEAEMCGNGLRCFAKYVYEQGLTDKIDLEIETGAGIIRPSLIVSDGEVTTVRVDMGEPRLAREQIPMTGQPADEPVVSAHLPVSGLDMTVTCVSMGNPHCVVFVDDLTQYPVTEIGPAIENHPAFPRRTNVEFAQVVDRARINLRVWERGAGETLACGTGASATCVAGALNDLTDRQIDIKLLGGDLELEWAEDDHVFLTGPASGVFDGEFDPDALLADLAERTGG